MTVHLTTCFMAQGVPQQLYGIDCGVFMVMVSYHAPFICFIIPFLTHSILFSNVIMANIFSKMTIN